MYPIMNFQTAAARRIVMSTRIISPTRCGSTCLRLRATSSRGKRDDLTPDGATGA
jgi:hypothetical protein